MRRLLYRPLFEADAVKKNAAAPLGGPIGRWGGALRRTSVLARRDKTLAQGGFTPPEQVG